MRRLAVVTGLHRGNSGYEVTVQSIGPQPGEPKELRVLGREIAYEGTGIRYEADPQHAEQIVAQLGLAQCREVATP